MQRSFRRSKHRAAAMTDAERDAIAAYSQARGRAQWGKPLHPKTIEVLRRLHTSVNSSNQKAAS